MTAEPLQRRDDPGRRADTLILTLQERAKELACLYRVEEQLREVDRPLDEVLQLVAAVLPTGFQYPDVCEACITLGDQSFRTPCFAETPWLTRADIRVQDSVEGTVAVAYIEDRPVQAVGPFLQDEIRLIETIAGRVGAFVLHQRLKSLFADRAFLEQPQGGRREWMVALDLLRKTDPPLLERVARKMMNLLCLNGVPEARVLLQRYGDSHGDEIGIREGNQPRSRSSREAMLELCTETFEVASAAFSDEEILTRIQKWINEDRSLLLITPLNDDQAKVAEISEALKRYEHLQPDGVHLSEAAQAGVRVALIRRFFTEQLEFINVAKRYLLISDFFEIRKRLISTSSSRGKLGGKSGGMLIASAILRKERERAQSIGEFKTPRTWFIASDTMLEFMHHNNLDDLHDHKYKAVDEIRQEYAHIVQVFKSSHFPQEIINGVSLALDDLGTRPLIVRSSSLLEDRLGSAFSGKYKSLFLPNQGSKQVRLAALLDAIAEVFASVFGPDPIEYRRERGLLDFAEEMGIMIQEVVGQRVGPYFLPAFAGVALSRNEFRWSPRIRREDGLLRLVPGLGTRAVDRMADDYPVLVAPGQPNLRVNVSIDEVARYAPKKVDAINLETNTFETLELRKLLRRHGDEFKGLPQIVSILRDGVIERLQPFFTDYEQDDLITTFHGLVDESPFVGKIAAMLKALEAAMGTPVDIEFASDGVDFFLLQCRPQSSATSEAPAEIPRGLPPEALLFEAHRFVSNGRVPDATHVVYVRPDRYAELASMEALSAVGQAVGRLNKLLPKRRFLLIGPGRWGSRGDIKLGVRVTYADINNTSLLVEVARKKGNYVPDLSFGTHFFQDLVEAQIRYLPLYPDEPGGSFNEDLLLRSPNVLEELLPEYAWLQDVVRVVDLPQAWGKVLRVLMNAERDEAVGILIDPSGTAEAEAPAPQTTPRSGAPTADAHWRWRLRMAEKLGASLDGQRFGVAALYVFGSVKNATAGPGSDIDLLVHFRGTPDERRELEIWLEGWSGCLAEMNYLRTGYVSAGLLDVHFVTDEDIAARTGFAIRIGATSDAARRLPLKE